MLFQDILKEKKPHDTPTSKVLSRKYDDNSKDKTLSHDTPIHEIHPKKFNDKIEVYNIIARHINYISLIYYCFQNIWASKERDNDSPKKYEKVGVYIFKL